MSRRDLRVASVPRSLYERLTRLLAGREPVVMVTVVEARGSAPGKAGAKMLVTARMTAGTVGGGKVEAAAIEHARSLLGGLGAPELVTYDVIRDLGMTCGGTMTLLYERHTPPARLVIFGAGHVAEPLCAMASLAGFAVTVCDDREDWLSEERFPTAESRILAPMDDAVAEARVDAHTFVASVSRGHAVDQEVVRAIAGLPEPPRYLGVIGSKRKGVELRKGLEEAGVAKAFLDRIRIPMGLNLGAADPPEIAVSIVAELVAELRGMTPVEPW
jgi:xanthine dehydrogenase accessory factor